MAAPPRVWARWRGGFKLLDWRGWGPTDQVLYSPLGYPRREKALALQWHPSRSDQGCSPLPAALPARGSRPDGWTRQHLSVQLKVTGQVFFQEVASVRDLGLPSSPRG